LKILLGSLVESSTETETFHWNPTRLSSSQQALLITREIIWKNNNMYK